MRLSAQDSPRPQAQNGLRRNAPFKKVTLMKKFILLLPLIYILLPILALANPWGGETTDTMMAPIEEILTDFGDLYTPHIERSIANLEGSGFEEIMPDFDVGQLLAEISMGRISFEPGSMLRNILLLLGREVYATFRIMIMILVLAVMCSLLTTMTDNMKNPLGGNNVGQIAFFACYILIVTIAIAAFYGAITAGQEAVGNMVMIMRTILILAIAALTASGAPITAAMVHPTILVTIEILVTIIQNVLIPVLMLSAALNVVNNISDRFGARKLAELLNKFVKWSLGGLLTIFVAIVAIQSIATSGADGITIKVARYAATNFIPVVGGILAETVETVMACSVLMKNAVGIVGMIIIVVVAAYPLIRIMAQIIIFRITAAVIQPIADKRIVACIGGLADAIGVMFAIVAAVAVMFLILITILLNAGQSVMIIGR